MGLWTKLFRRVPITQQQSATTAGVPVQDSQLESQSRAVHGPRAHPELPTSYPAPHPGDTPHPRLSRKFACDTCSKPLHPPSGGLVVTLGLAYHESSRYVCYRCGTVSCFECSAKAFKEPSWMNALWRAICKECGHEMVYG